MVAFVNPDTQAALDPGRDCCSLDEWLNQTDPQYVAAMHPQGFLVFLPPAEIALFDEYAQGDPYGVETNMEGDFQRRRTAMTLSALARVPAALDGHLRVLDLGCGEGHITQRLKEELGDSSDVVGVDGALTAISRGRELYPGLELHVADAYRLPFPDGSFDLVVLNNLWEHVPDPLRLLAGISRVTKPGGYVLISTPSRFRLTNLVRAAKGKDVEFMSSHHVTEYTVGQVREQLRFGGYERVQVITERFQTDRKATLARIPIQAWLTLTKSHHSLEPTIFYLAQKR